jgi:hypothetical protein
MTPTIYAVAWLVLHTYYGGCEFVPMPSMSFCQETLSREEFTTTKGNYLFSAFCVPGQPTQTDKE